MVERNSVKRLQVRVDEVMTRIVFDEVMLANDALESKGKEASYDIPGKGGFLRLS